MRSSPACRPVRISALSLPDRGWIGLALAVVAIAVIGIAAPSSSAYIYAGGPLHGPVRIPSTVERVTQDGSFVQPNFIAGPRVESADQLHVYGDRLYWLDSSAGVECRVQSASLTGEDVRTLGTVATSERLPDPEVPNGSGCGSARSIALAGEYLYWNDPDAATIGRLSIRPPYSMQPHFIRLPEVPGYLSYGETIGLVAADPWLYWWDGTRRTIGRARLDGTDVEPALFQPEGPLRSARPIGVAQGYLWWAGHGLAGGTVGRARLDGSDPERAYLTGVDGFDYVLTPPWLYYTGTPCHPRGCLAVDGAVRRIALEPGATPDLIARLGAGVGYSIAVDSLDVPFSVRRIRKHRNGTATAVVSTPDPADVLVRGRRIVPESARYRGSKVARVDIRPRRKAVRALRRHRAARVRVRIKVRPSEGSQWLHNRRLTLRLGRRR
jgi:hypothetical protein